MILVFVGFLIDYSIYPFWDDYIHKLVVCISAMMKSCKSKKKEQAVSVNKFKDSDTLNLQKEDEMSKKLTEVKER
jgi:hypothetical protein